MLIIFIYLALYIFLSPALSNNPYYNAGIAVDVNTSSNLILTGIETIYTEPYNIINIFTKSNLQETIFLQGVNFTQRNGWRYSNIRCEGDFTSRDIMFDDYNNVYIVGFYSNDISFGLLNSFEFSSINESIDIFIANYYEDGSLNWVTSIGGEGDDFGFAIEVVDQKGIFIAGQNSNILNLEDIKGYTVMEKGNGDCYISNLDFDGKFNWITTWGGEGDDSVLSITNTDHNNMLLCGYFSNLIEVDLNEQTFKYQSNGNTDAFLGLIDYDGSLTKYITWGGSDRDKATCCAIDHEDNIYVIGHYHNSLIMQNDNGSEEIKSEGNYDVFIIKYNYEFEMQWIKSVGGSGNDYAYNLAINDKNQIFIVGNYEGQVDFSLEINLENNNMLKRTCGKADAYILHLNQYGELIWVNTWGSELHDDYAWDITVDQEGFAYVTGSIANEDYLYVFSEDGSQINNLNWIEELSN